MDDEHTLHEADARLRAVLNPGDAVSHRLVVRALKDAGTPRGNSRRLRYASALAVGAVVLLVAVWRPRPVPPPATAASASAPLAVTGSGSMVVVAHPDGRRWIVGPPPEPRAGGNYVIVLER